MGRKEGIGEKRGREHMGVNWVKKWMAVRKGIERKRWNGREIWEGGMRWTVMRDGMYGKEDGVGNIGWVL